MKKVLILCLSLLLVFAVVGCQKTETNNAQQGNPKENNSQTENTEDDDVIPEVPRSPIYQESLEDIVSASVTLLPPDKTIELLSVSVDEFVTLIHDIRFYEKDESWQPAPGQVITFVAVKADGSDVEISVYDAVVVVDGVAYKCNTESCEALRSFANRILVDGLVDYEGFSPDGDYPSEGKYELETDEQEQIRLILLRKDGMWLGIPECEWSWAFEVKDSDSTKLDLHLCRCHTIIDMTNRRSVTLFDSEYQQILDILSNHEEPSVQG